MSKKSILKIVIGLVIAALLITLGAALASCNVTRRVTTESAFYQKGDTTVQIVTKTTESYDATKKLPR